MFCTLIDLSVDEVQMSKPTSKAMVIGSQPPEGGRVERPLNRSLGPQMGIFTCIVISCIHHPNCNKMFNPRVTVVINEV